MTSRGLFITGTGTGVGKTHVACMIARALVRDGRRVGVYKPVASGCRLEGDSLVADDAVALWEAAGRPDSLERVCPQRFLAPLAPHRAAREERKQVEPALLRAGILPWRLVSDVVLVEGAGGLMSPLGDALYNLDLASEFGYPLVIVAANELGTINATLQTVITAQARTPRLPLAGVVLNQPSRRDDDVSVASNSEELAARCPVPILANVDYGRATFSQPVDWFALATI